MSLDFSKERLEFFFSPFKELLFPQFCLVCREQFAGESSWLCASCQQCLCFIPPGYSCQLCGHRLASSSSSTPAHLFHSCSCPHAAPSLPSSLAPNLYWPTLDNVRSLRLWSVEIDESNLADEVGFKALRKQRARLQTIVKSLYESPSGLSLLTKALVIAYGERGWPLPDIIAPLPVSLEASSALFEEELFLLQALERLEREKRWLAVMERFEALFARHYSEPLFPPLRAVTMAHYASDLFDAFFGEATPSRRCELWPPPPKKRARGETTYCFISSLAAPRAFLDWLERHPWARHESFVLLSVI